jgi:hypothetical protein
MGAGPSLAGGMAPLLHLLQLLQLEPQRLSSFQRTEYVDSIDGRFNAASPAPAKRAPYKKPEGAVA